MKKVRVLASGVIAAGSLAGIGGGLASAATDTSADNQTSQSQTKDDKGPQARDGGVIVSDSTVTDAVNQAVQAKSSGATVDRVAKLPDGSYLAFTQKDGNKVIMSLDSSYNITATKDVPAGAPKDGPKGTPPTGTPPADAPTQNQ